MAIILALMVLPPVVLGVAILLIRGRRRARVVPDDTDPPKDAA